MKKEITALLLAAALALLFIYASFSKVLDWQEFERSMYNQTFPHWMAGILMWTVPPVEIIIAIFLMADRFRYRAFVASSALMLTFTLYIASVLLNFYPRVPCSCGGVLKSLGWGEHLVFNLIFLGIAVAGMLLTRKRISEDRFDKPKLNPA